TPLSTRLEETRCAVADGAHEIDMVISREAFLSGDDTRVATEIALVKDACGEAHLKVILETAELGSYDHVRHASMLAMEAGADFIKTSTGKPASGPTPGVTLVMLEAIRDYAERSGRAVGMKAAGGVSTSKAALHRRGLVKGTPGDAGRSTGRPPRAQRAGGRDEGGRRGLDEQGGAAPAGAGEGDARRRVADPRSLPHRRL